MCIKTERIMYKAFPNTHRFAIKRMMLCFMQSWSEVYWKAKIFLNHPYKQNWKSCFNYVFYVYKKLAAEIKKYKTQWYFYFYYFLSLQKDV